MSITPILRKPCFNLLKRSFNFFFLRFNLLKRSFNLLKQGFIFLSPYCKKIGFIEKNTKGNLRVFCLGFIF